MLAETQARFRRALDAADVAEVLPLLTGVPDGAARMEIYRRHHRESLVRHLQGRFPTVEWLLGPVATRQLAQRFIAAHAPVGPCMAEYGRGFVAFIDAAEEGKRYPYLRAAAEIDWLLGGVAIEVDAPPLPIAALASCAPEDLPELTLRLQPGACYLAAEWPVDELVRVRLGERSPEQFVLHARAVRLEVSGARGAFAITRLDAGDFAFRRCLADGASIGAAVDAAVQQDARFDPGAGLAALFGARLVIAVKNLKRNIP